jgi:3-dehydroquinate synthase
MLEELQPNLFEEELERKVDFGHTFSQGLEARHGERLLHGEAVLLDIMVSCLVARRRGLLSDAETGRIFRLIERLGIEPETALLDVEVAWQSLLDRVEHRNGLQRVPLPRRLGGCVFVNDITRQEIAEAVTALNQRMAVENEPILER